MRFLIADDLGVAGDLARQTPPHECVRARTMLFKTHDGYVVAVLPEAHVVDVESLCALVGEACLRPATEHETRMLFGESASVPAFGSDYGLRTVVDVHLASAPAFKIEASGRRPALWTTFKDFELVENPLVGLIAVCPCRAT